MYDSSYYNKFRSGSARSAAVVVPLIVEWMQPRSVIDLGCGTGDWLSIHANSGIRDFAGVDGAHVRLEDLAIPREMFIPHDLTHPYRSDRRFDLAMSVEVAEHLPQESGVHLIRSLTELSCVVLFSAAIPHQRGKGHVNCQWPPYWSGLFESHGFAAIDALRPLLWNDKRVDWWYRQNLVLYASEEGMERNPRLRELRVPGSTPLSLVHPDMFQETYGDLLQWGIEWEKKYWELRSRGGDFAL
jgi:hypothetical protein